MAKVIQLITKGATEQISTVEVGAGKAANTLIIKAQAGVKYELKDAATKFAPHQLLLVRKGKDLWIKLDDEEEDALNTTDAPDIIIENYYDDSPGSLIGLSEDGQYYNYAPQEGNSDLFALNMNDGEFSYQSLGYSDVIGENNWAPYILGALLLGGLAYVLNDDDDNPPLPPTIDTVEPGQPGTGDDAVEEGQDLVYTVTLTNASTTDTIFSFSLGGGTASPSDYGSPTFSDGVIDNGDGTITVPAGVTSFTVTVPTIDDAIDEPDETLPLTVGGVTGIGTIVDNDGSSPVLDLDANDSSGALGANFNTTFTENGGAISIGDTDVLITDADDTNIESATITLTNAQAGDIMAAGAMPAGITAIVVGNVVTLSGSATLADYQTAIEAVTFNNTSENPDTTPRTVTVVVNDGTNDSNTATTTITVNTADDDAPALDLDANDSSGALGANFNTAFTENGGAISIGDTDVLITDVDDTNIESATITLTNAQAGDVMAAGAMPAGITAVVVGNVVTLSGSASLADYQTAIEAITFNNTSENPDTTPRTVTVVVNDGLNDSNTATTTITVNAADNDAPVLDLDADDSTTTGANYLTTFTESGAAVPIGDTDVLITDVDDTNIESATITLTNAQAGDIMAAGAMPAGITAVVAGNVVTLSGSATLADYQTAIEAVTFSNPNAGLDATNRTVTVVVNDGTNDSNTATTTILIDTVANDAPVLDLDANDSSGALGANFNTTFAELGGAIPIGDTDVLITDADDTNIESATITLTNAQAGDIMAAGAMPAGITAVVVGNVVTLSGSASLADYQTAIEAITFNNPNDNPDTTPRTVTVVVNDGTDDSNTATTTITINVTPIIIDASANVSEEGLPGAASDTTGTPTDTTNFATVSGTMSISDASGIASVAVSGPVGLTSGGVAITWSGSFVGDTYTLTGMAGATPVATLTLNTAGAYTFTLLEPFDHPIVDVEDILALGFSVTATDIHANANSGTLTINVEDDMPLAAASTTFIIETQPDTAAGSFVVSFGADGGYVSQISFDGNTYTYDIGADTVTEVGGSTLVESWSFNADNDELTINTTLGETFVVDMHTGEYSYAALGTDEQVGPVVNVNPSASLLGIANVGALDIIGIGTNQMFTAVDANNDIEEVIVRADSLISLGLGSFYNLTWSAQMAAEFGLNVVETNDIINLILITTQSYSQLVITSIDGGPIDNLRLNEFLATVYVDQTGLDLLSLGLLPELSITATDSLANSATDTEQDVLGLSLLDPSSSPANIIEGDGGANGLNGGIEDDRIYGYGGNDVINGGEGNDLLRGGLGNDVLIGAAGNDIIIGGKGNDTASGGSGNDTFIWEEDDEGIAGTPATDTITDFNASPVAGGGDIINLSGLLIGELARGNTVGNLTDYMHFVLSGADTILYISTTGGFSGGFVLGAADEQITFTGVDLIGDFTTDEEVIAQLLENGNLITDQATTATDQLDGITTFGATITDNDDDTVSTSVSFDTSDPAAPIPGNVAPVVQDEATALLGLVGLNLLDLIDLESQAFAAADEDGNLRSVVVEYVGVVDVSLEDPVFTASQKLAEELGLKFTVVSTPGTLVIGPTSTITITAIDGGNIDNQAVNELLATVRLESTADLLGLFPTLDVTLLGTFNITATDSEGLTDTEAVTTLANANVLEGLLGDEGNPDIIEGTSANDTLTSSVAGTSDERLYGHEGDDTIDGGAGNDLIRGGAGNDTLNGGDGNDILIDGNGADTFNGGAGNDWIVISDTSSFVSIDGGTGVDTLFLSGSGMTLDLAGISGTTVTSIEKIDLTGTGNNSLIISYGDLINLSESSDILYVTGDSGDTVTLSEETFLATDIVDGITYDTYNIGGTATADIWVQQGVTVL